MPAFPVALLIGFAAVLVYSQLAKAKRHHVFVALALVTLVLFVGNRDVSLDADEAPAENPTRIAAPPRQPRRIPEPGTHPPEPGMHLARAKSKETARRAPKKYLTYDRFPGRFNNQLFQLVSALQHATILRRTLIIPDEITHVQWTGMFDPELKIWDLRELHRRYDVEFYDSQRHDSILKAVRPPCKVPPKKFLIFLKYDGYKEYDSCDTINIGGAGGLLFCSQNRFCGIPSQERIAHEIYTAFRIHASLMQYVPRGAYPLGVHSRAHHRLSPGWRKSNNQFSSSVCYDMHMKILWQHVNSPSEQLKDWVIAQCTVWLDIPGQLIHGDGESMPENFILASDMTHDFAGIKHVIANVPPLKSVGVYKATGKGPKHFEPSLSDINTIRQVVVEIWSLKAPKYFVGSLFSTFTLTTCLLRGEARNKDSNVCWMLVHPDKNKLSMNYVNEVAGKALRGIPKPLPTVPLLGSVVQCKDCAKIKASCSAHWSKSARVAVVHIEKCGSSTIRELFSKTFKDANMMRCDALPRNAIVGAFVRDPAERFFSGYDEAVYRSINEYKGRENKIPPMVRKDIEGYSDWHKYWSGSKTATDTFHSYVDRGHNVNAPFDPHLNQQSAILAGVEEFWLGRVSDLATDWARFLHFANIKTAAAAAPKELPKRRENKWRHLFPHKTPKNVMKKICKLVEQDIVCLGLQSKWCQ